MNVEELEITPAESQPFVAPDHKASRDDSKPRFSQNSRAKFSKAARGSEPPSRPGEFTEMIADLYRLVGSFLLPFDAQCAMVILEVDEDAGKDRAWKCAESLDAAAQKSPGLRKLLRAASTGGVWGGVLVAHAPIIMAIAAHHSPMKTSMGQVTDED